MSDDTLDIVIKNNDEELIGDLHEWAPELRVTLDEDKSSAVIEVVDRHSSNNGVPISIWNGRDLRWSRYTKRGAGVVDRSALEALAEKLRPLLNTIAEGHEVAWDGRNMSGRFTTDEAEQASEEIDRIVEDYQWDTGQAVWDADEWVSHDWRMNAKNLKLTADATPADKEAAETELEKWARDDGIRLIDPSGAIEWLIEKLAEERDAAA